MLRDSHIEDYQYVKPHLSISLINAGANRRKLLHMPYMEMEDLAMICRVEVPYPNGLVIVEVMNGSFKTWGVSKEAMFGAALNGHTERVCLFQKTLTGWKRNRDPICGSCRPSGEISECPGQDWIYPVEDQCFQQKYPIGAGDH